MIFPIFASRSERALGRAAFCGALSVALLHGALASAGPATASKPGDPLPELPAIPSLEVPRPSPAELEEFDARLSKLCSADDGEREAARREALEVDAKSVPAIRFRLASTAEGSKHDNMKELLLKLRKKGRDGARESPGVERRL